MSDLLLFNKPFRVLSQFTDSSGRATLADFLSSSDIENFYPAGRLDYDSEGLLLLTNDGRLQHRVAHPEQKLPKTYWVQVEGQVTEAQLAQLQRGVKLNDGMTKPAKAIRLSEPVLWPRCPPVRFREAIPTDWLQITLTEGRNRQVRRMTAAVGLPTLRLVRAQIGPWRLADLAPGEYRRETIHLPQPSQKLGKPHSTKKRGEKKP